jgi:diguanylate cyclase (GGDEF)-like protein
MPRARTPIAFSLAAALLFGSYAVYALWGFGDAGVDAAYADWFLPSGFFVCGVATLSRARVRVERAPWVLIGLGLVLYAAGCVYFNLVFGDDPSPPFPSVADALWLPLYPLAFAAVVLLARHRFQRVPANVWLDGVIGGTVVAALAAGLLLEPVFEVTLDNGAASAARLAYPLGDLIPLGFIVVVWGLSGLRLSPYWVLLGAGFLLLAASDSIYVTQAAHGDWAPGGLLDLPYVLATAAFAAAAWAAPRQAPAAEHRLALSPSVPVGFAFVAVALMTLAVIGELNPLASGLAIATLLAIVVRLALTLTSLTRQSSDLAAQASTDALTGLTNHRAFHERLAQELDRARRQGDPLSVVTLDLDHFKNINDTYGHAEGDAALQAIALELGEQARRYDVVGRLGGEEFALILPGLDGASAFAVAERCRRAVSRLTVHGSTISCSAGVASFPADDPDGGRLLELADGALYWAKRSGRAQVRRFDPREVVLLSGSEQHRQVRALLERHDTLTPVFQPIIELTTGRIAGYEALTRFLATEPVRPPDQWFAQARRCGLGPALEARAIAVALSVRGRADHTFLSVNVSPAGLMSREVREVLPDDLRDIVIELTEDDIFSSDPALEATLADLRRRGGRIAVDDAGAGYAGLQQVVRLKPDILKLDRSLISGIHEDASKIALLEAMARFAATTGAAVCAEGIEEVAELRQLARFDVTYGQGYALGRPGPPWPGSDAAVAGEATAETRWGMRVTAGAENASGERTIGDISEALCRVRSRADLDRAIAMIERLMHADDIAVSAVVPRERCVQTLSSHDWGATTRYSFDDYPTTEQVIVHQTLGQIVDGDPAADPAELEVLREDNFAAVLLAPIIFRGETIGLLEVYRRTARPWAGTEVDQVRMLAHQLSAVLSGLGLAADGLAGVIVDVARPRPPAASEGVHPDERRIVERRAAGR